MALCLYSFATNIAINGCDASSWVCNILVVNNRWCQVALLGLVVCNFSGIL